MYYEDNQYPGVATVTIYGTGYYKGTATIHFKIIKKTEKFVSNVKLNRTSYTYTGKTIRPSVTVTVNGKKIGASAYKLYYKNNKIPELELCRSEESENTVVSTKRLPLRSCLQKLC